MPPGGKPFDVFISYSSADKLMADAACAVLERHRLRCWIASRDIPGGANYAEAIVRAIDDSCVLLLVLSAQANDSPHVQREVERAVRMRLNLLAFRVEDVQPTGTVDYGVRITHWLDAFTPPVEQHLEKLAAAVRALVGGETPAGPSPSPSPPRPARRRWLVAVGLMLLRSPPAPRPRLRSNRRRDPTPATRPQPLRGGRTNRPRLLPGGRAACRRSATG